MLPNTNIHEAYSESRQTYEMELSANIVYGLEPLLIAFAKISILDVWMGSEYAFVRLKDYFQIRI